MWYGLLLRYSGSLVHLCLQRATNATRWSMSYERNFFSTISTRRQAHILSCSQSTLVPLRSAESLQRKAYDHGPRSLPHSLSSLYAAMIKRKSRQEDIRWKAVEAVVGGRRGDGRSEKSFVVGVVFIIGVDTAQGSLTSESEGPCLWPLLFGEPKGARAVPLLPAVIADREFKPSLQGR